MVCHDHCYGFVTCVIQPPDCQRSSCLAAGQGARPLTAPPRTQPPPTTTAPAWPPALTAGEHGGTTWGVYLAVAPQDEGIDAPALVEAEDQAAADGYDALVLDLACDQGAAEALGLDVDAPLYAAAIYFATEEEAVLFEQLYRPEVLGHAQVATYCMD